MQPRAFRLIKHPTGIVRISLRPAAAGDTIMRLRERQIRKPQRLALGGIRPEEEDLVRIVLGLQPARDPLNRRQPADAGVRILASTRFAPVRIDAK